MSSASRDTFTRSFPIWMPFLSFFLPTYPARIAGTMLSLSIESTPLYLVLDLGGWEAFHRSLLSMMWWVSWKCPLSGWRRPLLFLVSWVFLSWKAVRFCQMPFPHLLKCYYIHWFSDVQPTLGSWDRSHCITVYILFICCWAQFPRMLLRVFASVFTKGIGL